MPKHETPDIMYEITWEVNNSGNEIQSVYVILEKKIFS